ncbi:hypothetical protein LCGC14_0810640 [marine sediment metagenome]|uniref:Uncharacterized protein n=1 Tax=marine sediment metagenome TaxID=412755 RepID=A0A0F9S6S5_9ZZZZ|nr:MAG: hypothetical protein Lokiarch_11280 [Candidatus Lokiarchaeum sp. GC14_75]
MMNNLNHMEKMLNEIERVITHHEDPNIDISEILPKNIDNSFKQMKWIYKELRSIVGELKHGNYNISTE